MYEACERRGQSPDEGTLFQTPPVTGSLRMRLQVAQERAHTALVRLGCDACALAKSASLADETVSEPSEWIQIGRAEIGRAELHDPRTTHDATRSLAQSSLRFGRPDSDRSQFRLLPERESSMAIAILRTMSLAPVHNHYFSYL